MRSTYVLYAFSQFSIKQFILFIKINSMFLLKKI